MVRVSPRCATLPMQHGVHVEFLADFLGIDVAPFVAEDRAAGHYAQLRHAGKTADNSFRDPVGEILDIRVSPDVYEGQNGNRVNVARSASSQQSITQTARKQDGDQQQDQHDCGCDDSGFPPRNLRSLRRHEGGNSGRLRVTLDPLEVGLEFGGGLISQVAVFLQQLAYDPAQVRNQFGIYPGRRQRGAVQNGLENHRRGSAPEGEPSGRHFIQHCAQRKEIATPVQFFPAGLFRRHVRDRAERHSRAGQVVHSAQSGHGRGSDLFCRGLALGRHQLGQSEIQDLRLRALGQEDIRGLEVPMDDPGLVGGFERIGDLDCNFEGLSPGQRLPRNHVLERLPFQQLHHDEGLTLELVNFVDGANVGVVETGGGTGFALKALQGLRVADQIGREELQGNASTQSEILGAVNHSHAAAAQLFFDSVVRDDLA